MKNVIARHYSLAETYNLMLTKFVEYDPAKLPCAAYNTNRFSVTGEMIVDCPLYDPMISLCGIHDPHSLQQYTMEMLDGILDFEVPKKWNYTYHDRMVRPVNQIDAVIRELSNDIYSRRAVINIRTHDDIGSDDPACLQHIQFLFNGESLDMYVLFRSNDLAKATFMNAFALIQLGKRICDTLGVPMGMYYHRANDLHVYEKDYDTVKKYVQRIHDNPDDCVDLYYGFWDEMMEDEIPAILKKVEGLKR